MHSLYLKIVWSSCAHLVSIKSIFEYNNKMITWVERAHKSTDASIYLNFFFLMAVRLCCVSLSHSLYRNVYDWNFFFLVCVCLFCLFVVVCFRLNLACKFFEIGTIYLVEICIYSLSIFDASKWERGFSLKPTATIQKFN